MMSLNLAVKTREVKGKKVNALREQGKIPAVLYGHGFKPVNIVVDNHAFDKVYRQAGESTLIDLVLDEKKPIKALIQEVQMDPLTDKIIHIDLRTVRMDEKLHAEVQIKFVGEAPAVKKISGILVTNLDSIEVECLPQDLVHEIEVDLSSLKAFGDAIHISDIKVPSGIKILKDSREAVALIQEPRSEKELAELEQKPEQPLPEQVVEPKEGEAESQEQQEKSAE